MSIRAAPGSYIRARGAGFMPLILLVSHIILLARRGADQGVDSRRSAIIPGWRKRFPAGRVRKLRWEARRNSGRGDTPPSRGHGEPGDGGAILAGIFQALRAPSARALISTLRSALLAPVQRLEFEEFGLRLLPARPWPLRSGRQVGDRALEVFAARHRGARIGSDRRNAGVADARIAFPRRRSRESRSSVIARELGHHDFDLAHPATLSST